MASLPKFKNFFNELDNKFEEFNIQTYGISITSLEEVFLKVASGLEHEDNPQVHRKLSKVLFIYFLILYFSN